MGRIHKRRDRIRTHRSGVRDAHGEFAERAYRRADGAVVKVGWRIGGRNRSLYEAMIGTINGPGQMSTTTITAKAIRKLDRDGRRIA